jgi:tRNA(Ile)-lysidine synthase
MSNRPPAFTAERLLQILRSFPVVNAYIVGFSGGADSTALLHALSTIQSQLKIPFSAVHINHGLHGDADLWQSQCEQFCSRLGIKLVSLNINPDNRSGKGLEAEARHLRYAAISTLLEPGACLLTAHHADDQAETLLLNLMRGSGVDGLSAMPESRPIAEGSLQRPLLAFQGSALRDYLKEHNIEWSEDPSNQHLDHDRNFVRHEVMPLLESRWPGVSKRLLLTRKAMTGARHILEWVADDYLEQGLKHPFVLQLSPHLNEDSELLKLVVRHWMKLAEVPSIPAYRLESLCEQIKQPSRNHNVTVDWAGHSLHLFKQQLWLQTDREIVPCPTLKWSAGTEIDLGDDVGLLVLEGSGSCVPGGKFSVGSRSNMEGAAISQGGHHKSLKNLFQSAGIPPWLRDCIPLCELDGELVAMGDWCLSEQLETWMSENNTSLGWRPRNPLLKYVHTQQNSDPGSL